MVLRLGTSSTTNPRRKGGGAENTLLIGPCDIYKVPPTVHANRYILQDP